MPRPTVVDPRFAARLKQLRDERGMSLQRLAAAVFTVKSHISALERGLKTPGIRVAQALDTALGADGELKSMVSEPKGSTEQGADKTGGWAPRGESFGRRDAESLAAALVAERPTSENALRLAHEWMVAEPPQVYEARAGRCIGASTVHEVEQRVHQLRLLDDHVGGTDSYTIVTAELVTTSALLREASYTGAVGRRLLIAVGELAQLAGWVASDAGRHAEAERLYLNGARAAHAGGDTAGAANNLSCLAYQWANLGRSRDAVLLARTAAHRAAADVPATVRAMLLERAAWAHAVAGEPAACARSLGQVEEAFADRKPEDDPLWTYWLDADEVEIMAGRCWTELERPLRAVPILREATDRYHGDRARESALYLSWLAEALLQAHEVDGAAMTALRALRLSKETHSSRADERVAHLRQRMSSMRGTASVDMFEDEFLAEYSA